MQVRFSTIAAAAAQVRTSAIIFQNTGFASSTVRMIDLVRNGVEALGLDLESDVRRASPIPAKIAQVDDRKGTLEPGKDADIEIVTCPQRTVTSRSLVNWTAANGCELVKTYGGGSLHWIYWVPLVVRI